MIDPLAAAGASAGLILAAAPAGAAEAPPAWINFLPIIGMVLIFYFLLFRPQMRQQKAHREKIAAVKKGDQVVTAGGIVGKVVKVDDAYVDIEIAQGVRVKAVKQTLGDIIPPGGSAAND
ncbi:MAG: preprotein translocase subunit YajC [Erythrobacter sp.]|jgi:preprotein translocase subunit YajC|nr:preprotein translocase subunit YajC [Erythrobacter sp.]